MRRPSERGLTGLGWWLFVASAAFFLVAGLRAGDWLATLGSLAFMAANVAFLTAHYRARPPRPRDDPED